MEDENTLAQAILEAGSRIAQGLYRIAHALEAKQEEDLQAAEDAYYDAIPDGPSKPVINPFRKPFE
jgi:hypothetical protein